MARFEDLPKELLLHIATHLNTLSALSLASTSHTLRSAIHDVQTFKAILLASHANLTIPKQPPPPSLNLPALTTRCTINPNLWARYALAHELASASQSNETASKHQRDFLLLHLPALLLVSFPPLSRFFILHGNSLLDTRPELLFSLALTLLHCPWTELDAPSILRHSPHTLPSACPTVLHALMKVISDLRASTAQRQRAWPFNQHARVPFIDLPTLARIPLTPTEATYELPLPFAPEKGTWEEWYQAHCRALFRGEGAVAGGTWNGYYLYSSGMTTLQQGFMPTVEPPMMGVKFVVDGPGWKGDGETGMRTSVRLKAEGCWDGIGRFEVMGRMGLRADDGAVEFVGEKAYARGGHRWEWDLRLTPLGLVGYWGNEGLRGDRNRRQGFLWLWREEWGG